jgi:hypothetical protein
MASRTGIYKTVALEGLTWAVVLTDPNEPRFMEVIAIFYDEARARDYAEAENGEPEARAEEAAPEVNTPISEPEPAPAKVETAKAAPVKTNGAEAELSQRQSAVLKALRQKMDENNLVAVRAAVLAQTANIPLGSLHSVLGSLEKKQLIQIAKSGSAKSPAVYQVF